MLEKIILEPLSEDQIANQDYALDELWMIKYENQTKGPFHTSDLKTFSNDNPEIMGHFTATNLFKNDFMPFYQHPHFQRRQPKLVQASSLVSDQMFLILKDGQKFGPISYEELKESLENRTFKLSDQLSVDKGQTWIKIYEHHQFDRRSRQTAGELPFIPNENLLNQAINNGEQMIHQAMIQQDEKDALAGLAFLSHGKEHAKKAQILREEKTSGGFKLPKKTDYKLIGTFAVIAIVAMASILNSNPSKEVAPTQVQTNVKAINNTQRAPKRIPASVKKEYKPLVSEKEPVKVFKPKAPVKRAAPKRYVKKELNKEKIRSREPKRITHFADEFDRIDTNNPDEQDRLDRDMASDERPDFYPEDELTQDQIEAIELGDPSLLDDAQIDDRDNY